MSKTYRVLGAALCLFVTVPVIAGEPRAPQAPVSTQVDLMSLSGTRQQIRQIPHQVLTTFDQGSQQVPTTRKAVVRRVISQAFEASHLERRVSVRMAKELPREHSAKVLDWLRSDLGRKISKLEDHGWTPQTVTQREAFAATLRTTPPSPTRLHLMRRLDLATSATETLLEAYEVSAFGSAIAQDSTRPAGERVGEDRIRVQIDLDRQRTRDRSQELVTTTFLFMYQPLSDLELERYVEFMESESGREYQEVATAALKDALYESGEAMSRGLASLLEKSKG